MLINKFFADNKKLGKYIPFHSNSINPRLFLEPALIMDIIVMFQCFLSLQLLLSLFLSSFSFFYLFIVHILALILGCIVI